MTSTNLTNPTAHDYINILPSDLGATVYVELLIIDPTAGITPTKVTTACGRPCGRVRGFAYVRDLCDPGPGRSVKSLLCSKGRSPSDYVPYYRDYNTNILSPALYSDMLYGRNSIVFVNAAMSPGQLSFAMEHIGSSREILPSRVPN